MIELNFLPPELRKKKKAMSSMPSVPSGLGLKILGVVSAVLLAIHLLVFVFTIFGKIYVSRQEKENKQKLPQAQEVARLKEQISKLEVEQNMFSGLFQRRTLWAEKLNIISNVIPKGVWLNRLIITDRIFSIEGSAVSLQNEEMVMIRSFLEGLKAKPAFSADFSDLALRSVQSRYIKNTEVFDFIIAGILKE